MNFCKIISFTKQIYENKSLSPNNVFTFKLSSFTTSTFLFKIFCFLLKIMFFNKNQTPMGPYGPQPGPGPNPDWAPSRARKICSGFFAQKLRIVRKTTFVV